MYKIVSSRKVPAKEEQELKYLDKQITTTILKVENTITGTQYTYPWSSELHDAIRTISIWKMTLTQFKTKISQSNQFNFLKKSMNELIHTH